jgi:hypothetical protein
MRKNLQKKAVTLAASLVKHIGLNTTLPFTEKPSAEPVSDAAPTDPATDSKPLIASDLFSLFTADIIKKEVTFIR